MIKDKPISCKNIIIPISVSLLINYKKLVKQLTNQWSENNSTGFENLKVNTILLKWVA